MMALIDYNNKQSNDDKKNETLEIIREEQLVSHTRILPDLRERKSQPPSLTPSPAILNQNNDKNIMLQEPSKLAKKQFNEADVEKMLKEKEDLLRQEFETKMTKEVSSLIDRFDFILRNEQIRTSYMLTEVHRERQEKVRALQTQLECKNMAGLMYVMCSERRKCKVEKLKIIEDYSNYINALHQILEDSQRLILNLSRGYKTAACVDNEWREKIKAIIEEFQNFIYHFGGGTPEENQYFFDLPKLMTTRTSVLEDLNEDPIDDPSLKDDKVAGGEVEEEEKKQWYERLDEECRPFIMYGDMADFKPDRRRSVLKNIKAQAVKTAPRRWKEYVFNDMYLKFNCTRANDNKEEIRSFYSPVKWDCPLIRDETMELTTFSTLPSGDMDSMRRSHGSSLKPENRRMTTTSMDARTMGSMLRIISSASASLRSQTKAVLLGARDSLEIASTTAMREKIEKKSVDHGKEMEKDNIGMRRTSFFEEARFYDFDKEDFDNGLQKVTDMDIRTVVKEKESNSSQITEMQHVDSLEVIPKHKPDVDHKIKREKVCPTEQCQRKNVKAFMRSLPTYMRLSPFEHFESSYDQYEACSPDMLKKRIEEKKRREKEARPDPTLENPLDEWNHSVGVAIQTSELSLDLAGHNVCNCQEPNFTPDLSAERMFKLEELISIKQKLDAIARECFYDDQIEFDRFKVVGENYKTNPIQIEENIKQFNENFNRDRAQGIRTILKTHPSLCDIFQANTKC